MRPVPPAVPRAAVPFILVPILLATATAVQAQGPRERLLVDAEWLAAHRADPELVLLHVGPEEEYAREHIPGAVHVGLSDISAPEDHEAGTGLSLQMPEPEALARTLEGYGIGDGSRVVVYFGTDWVTPSTRVVYTLDWIGLGDRSSLLDGGMPGWKAAGHAVTAEPSTPARGTLTPRVRRELVVDAEWVREHLDSPGYRVVDARAPVHYDGIQPTHLHRKPVRKGHVPGASNLPFSSLVDENLRLRSADELLRLYADAGVAPGDTVVGYCHLGQYATLVLFGARTLGHPVRLYDGSFQDWGSREELPVALPDGGR